MRTKHACEGGCQKCQPTPNPYDEGVRVVWHTPTAYDITKHGPPYLKLGSAQKAEVRKVLADQAAQVSDYIDVQAAYYDAFPVDQEPLRPLSWVLACMRALAFLHQTHHWQAKGTNAYGDHLLFMRLYEDSAPLIDQVAEKAVGMGSAKLVDPARQINNVHKILTMAAQSFGAGEGTSEQLVQRSLIGESLFLDFLARMTEKLDAAGQLSHGMSNLLEGVADKHEEFVYLLSQRTKTATYSYDRS